MPAFVGIASPDGTRAIEDPYVQVLSRPQAPVAEDEAMIFELEIANNGWGESSFFLFTEARDNSAGLAIDFHQDWILEGTKIGGSSSQVTLTIEKGPREDLFYFIYDPVKIYLQSKW